MAVMLNKTFLFVFIGVSMIGAVCSHSQVTNGVNSPPSAQSTPSNKFTTADIAKLKWIEGTWKGMDGDKPFYERYKIEETAMVVESLKADGSPKGEPERFELRNGEFGKDEGDNRSVASAITADYVQFVPAVPGKGNSFRFEPQANGTWRAVLEWSAKPNRPAGQKIYVMEPWKP